MAYIEEGAKIGENVKIGPFSCIYSDTVIGDGTIIENNVTIFPGARIGKNCHIKKAIIDRFNVLPNGMKVGLNKEEDSQNYFIDPSGIVIIPRGRTKFL